MSVPSSPVVNAGLKYVNGMQLSYPATASKLLNVAAGACRDSSNSNDIVLDAAVVINGANVGANGVDVAALANSSVYAVYVIASSNSVFTSSVDLGAGFLQPPGIINPAAAPANPYPVAAMMSLASNAAPVLPFGYDMYRRIGWAFTNGSANILPMWQYGSDETRKYYWDAIVATAVTAGNATSFTAVSLVASVPPIACEVVLDVALTPAVAGDLVAFRPSGSASSNGDARLSGVVVAVAQVAPVAVPCRLSSGVPTVEYKVSAGGDAVAVSVAGFVDYL